jgi:hypothetical protein
MAVQQVLLDSGCTLIQRWYADVPWGTELWRATQLLSLYQILDRHGDIDRDSTVPLASRAKWGVEAELSLEERQRAMARLKALIGQSPEAPAASLKAGEFAVWMARQLMPPGQP